MITTLNFVGEIFCFFNSMYCFLKRKKKWMKACCINYKIFKFLAKYRVQNFGGCNQRTWFQQIGGTLHTSNKSMPHAREIISQKLIPRRGDINYHPRSTDSYGDSSPLKEEYLENVFIKKKTWIWELTGDFT